MLCLLASLWRWRESAGGDAMEDFLIGLATWALCAVVIVGLFAVAIFAELVMMGWLGSWR